MKSSSKNGISLLKNAHTDEICALQVLHLRSDFDAQMQTDEATRSFSTGWHFRGDRADISDEYIKVSRSVPYAAGWLQLLRLVWGDACQKHTHG
jgi:hypothetical protein